MRHLPTRRARLFYIALAALLPASHRAAADLRVEIPPSDATTAHRATAPAPAVEDHKAIARQFADLADADGGVREKARLALMSLPASDLPALKQVVRDARPLMAGQSAALREIVTHVFLRGQAYDVGSGGFLGVSYLQTYGEVDEGEEQEEGVEIMRRIPGFAAYRALEDGDLILRVQMPALLVPPGFAPDGDASPAEGGRVTVRIESTDQFAQTIRRCSAGDRLVFEIVRRGRKMRVGVTLDARPRTLDLMGAQELESIRADEAEHYWDAEFAEVADEGAVVDAGVP